MHYYPKLTSESEGVVHETFLADGLIIVRTQHEQGDWYVTGYPVDLPFKEFASIHFQTSGVSRDNSLRLPDRIAWWMSTTDDGLALMGESTRVAVTPYEGWCIYAQDKSVDTSRVTLTKLATGEFTIIANGQDFFVASGEHTIDGVQYLRKYIRVRSGDKKLIATNTTYLLSWTSS